MNYLKEKAVKEKVTKKDIKEYMEKEVNKKWRAFLKHGQKEYHSEGIRALRQYRNQNAIFFLDRTIGDYVIINITDDKFYKKLCKAFPELVKK